MNIEQMIKLAYTIHADRLHEAEQARFLREYEANHPKEPSAFIRHIHHFFTWLLPSLTKFTKLASRDRSRQLLQQEGKSRP